MEYAWNYDDSKKKNILIVAYEEIGKTNAGGNFLLV